MIRQAIIDAAQEVFPMFGLESEYKGEVEESLLSSASQVNILIGLTSGVKGSVVFGLKKSLALKVASVMMGGAQIDILDEMTKSALGEMANMIIGSATGKIGLSQGIEYSPPTIITGERLFLIISRLKSQKLTFRLNEDVYNVSVCIE